MIPIFGLLETTAELKINLSCPVSCSALNCTVVQWWTLHGSSVLYCTTLYCTIQFCNALYCIIMYWSLMHSMVLSVLLRNGRAVYHPASILPSLVFDWAQAGIVIFGCRVHNSQWTFFRQTTYIGTINVSFRYVKWLLAINTIH